MLDFQMWYMFAGNVIPMLLIITTIMILQRIKQNEETADELYFSNRQNKVLYKKLYYI